MTDFSELYILFLLWPCSLHLFVTCACGFIALPLLFLMLSYGLKCERCRSKNTLNLSESTHKLNLSIAQSCQLASISNMMDAIACLANFFNYSPQRQKSFEVNVTKYPDSLKKTTTIVSNTMGRKIECITSYIISLKL